MTDSVHDLLSEEDEEDPREPQRQDEDGYDASRYLGNLDEGIEEDFEEVLLDERERLLYEAYTAADDSPESKDVLSASPTPPKLPPVKLVKGTPSRSRKLAFDHIPCNPTTAKEEIPEWLGETEDPAEYNLASARQRFTHNVLQSQVHPQPQSHVAQTSAPPSPPPACARLPGDHQHAPGSSAPHGLHPPLTQGSALLEQTLRAMPPTPLVQRPGALASQADAQGVWQNLAAIFADIDRGGSSVQTPELAAPLTQLRHLLQLHKHLVVEEHDLRKSHLGLLVEAGWHLEKLREIEELVSRSLPSEEAQLEVDGASNLATSLKHILIQEDTGFKLISSAIEGGMKERACG